jgi:hypothetical protein
VQIIDGRDLGTFTIHATEQSLSGAYHAAGPSPPLALEEFIAQGVALGGNVAQPVWVPGELLTASGVEPWSDLPLLTSFTREHSPLAKVDNRKAVAAGLRPRPVAATARDTLEWWRKERSGSAPKWGLDDAREAALLEAHGKSGGSGPQAGA